MDLVVKNGTVVTASDTYQADVGMAGEKIVEIGRDVVPDSGMRVIDATGKYVLPGGVVPHTHLDTPSQGTNTADDYLSGTSAAACGGTTSMSTSASRRRAKVSTTVSPAITSAPRAKPSSTTACMA
jgi:dihydropyrimidinase